MKAPFIPTARAAWIAAGAAPLALLIAALAPALWVLAPAAAIAFLAVLAADAALAARMVSWRLDTPANAEVGGSLPITLALALDAGRAPPRAPCASLGFDPRLGGGGRADLTLTPEDAEGRYSGKVTLSPERRGPAAIERVWLRWDGPLGLAARQVEIPLDRDIRVLPDLALVRSPELQAVLRNARHGLVARRLRGEGTQFEALSEYEPGMDRRWIDWKASARHTRLYARENEAERNNQIVFAFDTGQAMCEPVGGMARLDRAVGAALTCAYTALKGGDRVAFFGFARQPNLVTPFFGRPRDFHRLQEAAATLDYRAEEPNFTLAIATLSARLRRRSLVVIFSEFSDPAGAEIMVESVARIAGPHLVLFVTMADEELASIASAPPESSGALASAVAAEGLLHQRALVMSRLRHHGIDVIEAPHERIGYRLLDRYLDIKRHEAIG